jgi:threonine/homoserine/homoserine lactone efflux protein
MGSAIGQSLPVAVGVLISPLPIVAVVLMLVSRRAAVNATAFLLGWFLSVTVVTLVVAVLVGSATTDDGGPPAWAAWVKVVLGVLLVLLAVKQWRGRPQAGVAPETPKWMQAIDAFTPVRAFGLAVLLSAVNPKNLLLVVSGGAAIASASSDTSDQVAAAIVFALVASVGVATPVVISLAAGERAAAVLDELKAWMIQNNAVIMAVLLLVIGAKMIGDGISAI